MKQMKYTKESEMVILDKGIKNGIEWAIVSFGTHPVAYVGVPQSHPYYEKHYDNIINIKCHGGLTYANDKISNVNKSSHVWWLGWDYAHYNDYNEYFKNQKPKTKKWTTKEIKKEVMNVIKQLEITEITADRL